MVDMRKLSAWALCLVLAACGGGSSGDDDDGGGADGGGGGEADGGGGGPGAPTIEELCGAGGLFERYVLEAYRCTPELAVATYGTPEASELGTACLAFYQGFVDRDDVQLGSRAAFDACAEFITSDGCATIGLGEPSPCDGLLVGTLAPGMDCDDSIQCADGYCARGAGTCGTCTARKALDATCGDSDECASRRCSTAGRCINLGGAGATCETREDCLGNFWCDTALTCQPQPAWATGTPCGDALDCGAIGGDFYCAGDATCQPYANLTEACGASAGGKRCRIYQNQACVAGAGGSTCVMATLGAVGATCESYSANQCAAGLRCANHDHDNGTPRQCITALTVGMACDPLDSYCDQFLDCVDNECQYGHYTNFCPTR